MIYTQWITRDGDMLDDIIWRHYRRNDVLSAVMDANRHLAQLPPVLAAGLTVNLPDLDTVDEEQPVIRLWS